jgi:hypothetical protein
VILMGCFRTFHPADRTQCRRGIDDTKSFGGRTPSADCNVGNPPGARDRDC